MGLPLAQAVFLLLCKCVKALCASMLDVCSRNIWSPPCKAAPGGLPKFPAIYAPCKMSVEHTPAPHARTALIALYSQTAAVV